MGFSEDVRGETALSSIYSCNFVSVRSSDDADFPAKERMAGIHRGGISERASKKS